MNKKNIFLTGCALFAMLFGAGNIVFPLIIGRSLGTLTPWAMLGFMLTGVLMPLLGFFSVMLASGDNQKFLGTLGRLPGLAIGLLCMTLLGPAGATPRCIAIAYADLSWYMPGLSIWVFSACTCLGIWLFSYEKSRVIDLLGRYLGPLKILCLLAIALLGLMWPGEPMTPENIASSQSFMKGFYEGYGTMDLLAIIFFSSMIYGRLMKDEQATKRELMKRAAGVSLVCGLLLMLVYAGFAAIAALHGPRLGAIADDTILSALASLILGPKAGVFANITIALTCFATAIALSATFAEFIAQDIFLGRISYRLALALSIILSGLMATLRFTGIMSAILPWISLCYPALMVFAVLHIFIALDLLRVVYARIAFFAVVAITFLAGFMS
jgi:LIVCS family branched-chain amino acid:cation transporter